MTNDYSIQRYQYYCIAMNEPSQYLRIHFLILKQWHGSLDHLDPHTALHPSVLGIVDYCVRFASRCASLASRFCQICRVVHKKTKKKKTSMRVDVSRGQLTIDSQTRSLDHLVTVGWQWSHCLIAHCHLYTHHCLYLTSFRVAFFFLQTVITRNSLYRADCCWEWRNWWEFRWFRCRLDAYILRRMHLILLYKR